MCEEKKTDRCKMSDYINELKNDGYVPLRTQYYTNLQRSFPALDRNQPSSLTDPKQVDMLDQQTDQEEHPEKQEEEETPQVSPPAQDVSVPKDTSIDHTPASESANEVSDTPLVLTQLPVSETANDVTDAEAVKDTTDAPPPGRGPNLPKCQFTKQNHEFETTSLPIAILISLTYVLKKNF